MGNDNSLHLMSRRTENDNDSSEHSEIARWDDIQGLDNNLLRGIYAYGFENPSPIQKKGILPILNGHDTIGQAQSGTGKTGCFTVAALQLIDTQVNECQSLILAPTRELSRQIFEVTSSIASKMTDMRLKLLVGGTSIDDDVHNLKGKQPHMVIGCPGRVQDMIRRKHLSGTTIKLIVLDEADDLLSYGFKEQVYNIFQFLSRNVQVALFSATLPPEVQDLTEKFMRDPVKILVKADMLTLEGIAQHYVALEDDNQKYATLKDLFASISVSQAMIYCNSVRRVGDLHAALTEDGFSACCIHSSMEKEDRARSYQEFKEGKHRVLISSNVTARGIDIQQVSTVINFDIPRDVNTYLHRIGRSGRWGRKGVGINFVTRRDFRKMKDIESHYNTSITELPSSFVN